MSGAKYTATFTWPSAAPHDVVVTGSFDDWSGSKHHLTKIGETFQGEIELDWAQTYEYKYVVDGTWQAREDQDKEWDSQGNMNNVLRTPPRPAHAAEPAALPADKPAADLPAVTVVAPAPVPAESKPVMTPPGSGATGEDVTERKQTVKQAIDEATESTSSPDTLVAGQAPESTAHSTVGTLAPRTVESDLSSTKSVRAADGLAMSSGVSAHEPEQPEQTGGLTAAQKIATAADVKSTSLPADALAAEKASSPSVAEESSDIPSTTLASVGTTGAPSAPIVAEATTPKPLSKALEPITSTEDTAAPVSPSAAQAQLQHVAEEAQHLAEQGLEQAQQLAGQAASGVAGLVAGVEGLIFGGQKETFAENQTRALEKVDAGNLSENGTSATDFSLVDGASQTSDFHHVPTPPKLESDEPVVISQPSSSTGLTIPGGIAPPLDFSKLPAASGAPTATLASTLTTSAPTSSSTVHVTDQKKVDADRAPALEAAKQDLAARSAPAATTAAVPAPAAVVPESMTSSQISSAPTSSTSTATPTASSTPASSAAPVVPAKESPPGAPLPGDHPSTLSSESAPGSPSSKAKAEDDKLRKRKSSMFNRVSRIFSGSKDKAAK